MLRFLRMRILASIPVLFIMSIITFAIIQAPPGDYGDYIRSMMITQGHATSAVADAAAQQYREQHGLNDPMYVQYFRWIWGMVTRGDFGHSFYYNKPVAEVVAERLPRTHRAGADLPLPRDRLRRDLRRPGRDPAIFLGRHHCSPSSPSSG